MEDGKQFLQSSYKTFVDKMNQASLKQLLDYLYQEDMLTEAEKDEIEARETQSDKNRNAFAIIINKGNKVHETVIQYLKDNHKHEYEAMAKAAEKKKMRFGQMQASTGSQSDIEKYTDEHLEEIIKNLTKEVGSKEVKRIEKEVKDKVLKKKWAFPPSTAHTICKDKKIHTFLTKEASECSGKAFPLNKVIDCLFIRRAKAKTDPQASADACKESNPKKRKSKTQHLKEQKSGNRNKKGRSEKIDMLKTYLKEKKIDISTLKCINYREHNECRLFYVHDSMVYNDVNSKQDVLLITETPSEKSNTSEDNLFPHILNKDGLAGPYESKLQIQMGILGNILRAHVLFSGNKKPLYKLRYKKNNFLDLLDTFKSFVAEILIPVLAVYKQSQKETILKDFE